MPSTDAEVVVEQPHTGSRIVVKGGDTVSVDLSATHPTTLILKVPAAVYETKYFKPEPELPKVSWYEEAVMAHTMQTLREGGKKR